MQPNDLYTEKIGVVGCGIWNAGLYALPQKKIGAKKRNAEEVTRDRPIKPILFFLLMIQFHVWLLINSTILTDELRLR